MRLDHFPSLSWNWSSSGVFLFGTLTSKKLQVHLLFCLQIEYPMNVHLIRGNHEAADINALFGFRIECIERMVCAFSLPSTHVRHRLTIFSDAMMMDIHSYTNKSWWVLPNVPFLGNFCCNSGPSVPHNFFLSTDIMQGERDGIWVWQRINQLFNCLPLAAVIERKIICMHGGIGRSINYVQQIEDLKRPITMEAGSVVLMDLLWYVFLLRCWVNAIGAM